MKLNIIMLAIGLVSLTVLAGMVVLPIVKRLRKIAKWKLKFASLTILTLAAIIFVITKFG